MRERGWVSLARVAGCRYWTASLLPALVGTTLPLWLRPPGFSFDGVGAVTFVVATALFHAGFSSLRARFGGGAPAGWSESRLLGFAGACLGGSCLLGLYLHSRLAVHAGVPGYIFLVYGICALFAGVLCVVPPLNFYRRIGGETVVSGTVGLMPVLGAYLVQVGDVTRAVYLAAAPLVVATGLWVWVDELVTRPADEAIGRATMVTLLGPRASACYVVPALALLHFATILVAVATSSLSPWALSALLTAGLAGSIVATSRKHYDDPVRLREARSKAFVAHFVTGVVLTASSLVPPGS